MAGLGGASGLTREVGSGRRMVGTRREIRCARGLVRLPVMQPYGIRANRVTTGFAPMKGIRRYPASASASASAEARQFLTVDLDEAVEPDFKRFG
jgi:hypothetical protein